MAQVPGQKALEPLREAAQRWLAALGGRDRDRTNAAETELVRGARDLLDRHRDALEELLGQRSAAFLGLLQTIGRGAFLTLLSQLFGDPQRMDRLRRLAESIGKAIHAPPGVRSDARNDVILRLLVSLRQRWPDFVDEHQLDEYLARAVENMVADMARKNRRTKQHSDAVELEQLATDEPSPPAELVRRDAALAATQRRDRLTRAIAAQPAAFRAALTLRLEHRWDYTELAALWPDPNPKPGGAQSRDTRAKWIAREIRAFVQEHAGTADSETA